MAFLTRGLSGRRLGLCARDRDRDRGEGGGGNGVPVSSRGTGGGCGFRGRVDGRCLGCGYSGIVVVVVVAIVVATAAVDVGDKESGSFLAF